MTYNIRKTQGSDLEHLEAVERLAGKACKFTGLMDARSVPSKPNA